MRPSLRDEPPATEAVTVAGFGFATRPGAYAARWQPRGDYRGVLNLKSCEMQHPGADQLLAEVLSGLTAADVRSYPYHWDLMRALAAIDAAGTDNVMLTPGSYTAIGLVVDALAEPAGGLVLHEPAFFGWDDHAALRSVPVTRCPGLDGSPPRLVTAELQAAMARARRRVVALTNPGSPTGLVLPAHQVEDLARQALLHGHLLVIDECYGPFAGVSHVPLAMSMPNVLVIRSLSKSWALAGARLAVLFGAADLIDYLRRFKTDSPVSALAVALGTGLAASLPRLRAIWADVAAIRDEFTERVLSDHPGWAALRPGGNFMTFATGVPGGGKAVEQAMAERGIRIRGLEDVPGMAGCVRFSLAGRQQMSMVAEQLAALG